MRLDRKLARWTAAGLITPEQAEKVRTFEEARTPASGGKWVVWALASVGGLAVVAGVISLVAANWDEIPDHVKLAGGLTALVALALSAREVGERGDGWIRDLLLLVHQGMVLAMIGLVAQVYHLSGHPWRPFALALALAIPAAAAGRRAVLGDVVVYFALQTLWFLLDELELLDRLVDSFQIALCSSALGLGLAVAARPLAGALRHPGYAGVARRWAAGLIGLPIIVAAFTWSHASHRWWDRWPEGASWFAFYWPLLLFAAALAAAGFIQARRRRLDPGLAGTALFGALLVVGAVYLPDWDQLTRQIVGFVLCVGVAVSFTFAAARRGSRAGVNVGTLALAARVLGLFLELVDDLTRTGIGLIGTGLLLVGIAYGWWRLRVLVPVARSRSDTHDGDAP